MLSDETATSQNWKNTISWLYRYLNSKKRKNLSKATNINELIKRLKIKYWLFFSKKVFSGKF